MYSLIVHSVVSLRQSSPADKYRTIAISKSAALHDSPRLLILELTRTDSSKPGRSIQVYPRVSYKSRSNSTAKANECSERTERT